ncbi:MAG: hypothetical protein AAFQ68_05265 [Bacteroidota bacterium]
MPIELQNQQIKLVVATAGEHYQGTRFAWNCPILSLRFGEHEISTLEDPQQADNPRLGQAFYHEFGIDSPLGFAEAKSGDWVHKIGVGLIQKEDTAYDIHHQYQLRPAKFEHKLSDQLLQSVCYGPLQDGFAYRLEKEIRLLEDGFEISYQLHNLGQKRIQTDEYNHNFVALGAATIGPDHILRFPFALRPLAFGEVVNPQSVVRLGEKQLTFEDTPDSPFFFSNLSGGESVPAHWELRNQQNGLVLTESTDFQTRKINLWGSGHVISPELFFRIDLAPGQSVSWIRRYSVYSMEP